MKLKSTLLLCLFSIGIHLYLTNHYFTVQMGTNLEKSSCNINSTFNCDSVAASDYSAILGIPISAVGFSTNLILLLLVAIVAFRLTETPKKVVRASFWLATASLAASLVMGAISLAQLSSYCLYCIGLYVLSFLIFMLLLSYAKENKTPLSFSELLSDVSGYIKAPLWPIALTLSIPAIALLIHKSVQSTHQEGGAQDFNRLVKTSIADWQNSETVSFEGAKPSFVKGHKNSSAKIIIAEFADFRCGHCKRASGPLSTFVESHPDVELHFYNFPLDGACNDVIPKSNGISCRLAKSVHCANQQNLGKLFHDKIFEFQKDFYSIVSSDGVDNKLKSILKESSVKWPDLMTCMDSSQTHSEIKAQAELGKKVGVKGTPKIYFENKALPGGFFLPILKKARKLSLKNK